MLTTEDIRRQGAVSLPDALRTVPGLFVARFDSVVVDRDDAAGSPAPPPTRLLVMIDGRTVYSPLFSGVFWDQQDAMLLDLDRIEVVRGPGASLWGSNAVNGVINVVSKRAAETQGTLVSVGGGAEEQFHSIGPLRRHAPATGTIASTASSSSATLRTLASGGDADGWQRFGQAGFRWTSAAPVEPFTLQGDAVRDRAWRSAVRDDIEGDGANVLARWTRRASSGLGV